MQYHNICAVFINKDPKYSSSLLQEIISLNQIIVFLYVVLAEYKYVRSLTSDFRIFFFLYLALPSIHSSIGRGSVIRVGCPITVGGSIPTLTPQRLVNWQLEAVHLLATAEVPLSKALYHASWVLWMAAHRFSVYGICLHECVTLCMCMFVFNRCQPGWVKRGGVIVCISCIYMTINLILILSINTLCHTFCSIH